jgi:RluA family pseudouridine synthase
VVVDKPAGLPTQATLDKNRVHVYGLMQAQLKLQNPDSYLALHHRLDKDTSGVLLFCKDRRFNEKISEMFQHHEFQKIYWALTKKAPCPETWTVKNFLAEKDAPRSQRMSLESVKSGGKPAITHFRHLKTGKKSLLIEAQPLTGRMHQIRVHLAEGGHPILGDDLYNPTKIPQIPRMMLHAHQLIFKHPATGEPMTVTSPLPEDFAALVARL